MKSIEEIEKYKTTQGQEVEVTVTYLAKITATISLPKLGVEGIIRKMIIMDMIWKIESILNSLI